MSFLVMLSLKIFIVAFQSSLICSGVDLAQKFKQADKLFQDIKPNLTAAKGLLCYQCKSRSTEIHPFCDQSLFGLIDEKAKENMQFQCPHYKSAFCFIKIIYQGFSRFSIRGCTGQFDKNNNSLTNGCIRTAKMRYCLCDTRFCNGSESIFQFKILFLYFIGIVIFNIA